MNVAALKAALADLPDEAEVVLTIDSEDTEDVVCVDLESVVSDAAESNGLVELLGTVEAEPS